MKKLFASLVMCLVTLAVANPASAIVVSGSSYSVYLQGETSDNPSLPTVAFDNAPAAFLRDNLTVTLSESDTALTGTSNRISINLSADGDLFPVFNEGAFLGVGTFGDVLDLEAPVALYDARVTIRDLSGNVLFASENVADFALNNPPWDGSFPTTSTIFLVSEIGGQNASNITFDFYVTTDMSSDVPEPASILLCGAGLLAACGVRRQRSART